MRAVDADELIKELDKDGVMEYGAVSVFGVPIIEDCVPVVRCKDCKYWVRKKLGGRCDLNIRLGTSYNWFCADGKKVNDNV